MAKKQATSLTGRVTNTTLGTVNKRGDFIATLDDNGRTTKTKNIRVVSSVGTVFPATISSDRISNLSIMRNDLSLDQTDYVRSGEGSFEADDDKGLEAQDYAIYRPVTPENTF
jgi:hypothetical protein